MKKFILIIGFLAILIGISNVLAQTALPPGLKIGLVQTKAIPDYSPGEEIPLVLSLLNTGGQIITSQGFSQRPFYLYLAFTDPDGQVIHSYKLTGDPLDPEEKTKHLDPPPPPQVLIINNELIPVESIEFIAPNWALSFDNFNALDFYTLVKGGKYCVKAQIPMKTYSDSFDNEGQHYARLDWVNGSGLLESQPVCFNLHLPVNADLSLAQSVPVAAALGNDLTYTITVVNQGPDTARNVTLTDTLPPSGISFISASPEQFDCRATGRTITCHLGNLASEDSTTVTFLVGTTTAGVLTNSVTVSSEATDPTPTNNTSQVTTNITTGTPKISGSIPNKGRNPDGSFFLDLKLINNGTGNAQNVTISTIPLKTLSGRGMVTIHSQSPSLPLKLGDLVVNASTTVRLYFNVPSAVTRFSITENGTVQDVNKKTFGFSIGQAVIP